MTLTGPDLRPAAAGQERVDGVLALILGDRGIGQRGVEEYGLGVLLLDGRAHPGEVLRDELDEEVLQLGRLALGGVRQGVVLHGLGARPCRRSE